VSSDKLMSDRVLFALQNIVGQTVLVQTKTGTVYQGIFKTADINPRLKEVTEIVLHMVYTVHEGVAGAKTAPPPLTAGEVDGRPFRPRVQPTKEVAIAAADLAQVVVKDFGLLDDHSTAGAAGGDAGDVGTDAGISKGKLAGLVGRDLERWAPGADDATGLAGAPAPNGVSLELGDGGGGSYRRGGTCAGPVRSPVDDLTRACDCEF
jgi:small nuclear ribonucleoprotein (snRNP)-like protein